MCVIASDILSEMEGAEIEQHTSLCDHFTDWKSRGEKVESHTANSGIAEFSPAPTSSSVHSMLYCDMYTYQKQVLVRHLEEWICELTLPSSLHRYLNQLLK